MANETTVNKLPSRSEFPVEDTWRLEDIFASDDEWEKEFQEVKSLIPGVKEYEGKLGESADTLYKHCKNRTSYWNDWKTYMLIPICDMTRIRRIHFIKGLMTNEKSYIHRLQAVLPILFLKY